MSCAAQRCAAARARAALDSIVSLVAAYQQRLQDLFLPL